MNLGNQKERQAHDKRRKSDSPALWQTAEVASVCCANTPGVTRTPDRRFRKPLLYPAELRGQRSLVQERGQSSDPLPATTPFHETRTRSPCLMILPESWVAEKCQIPLAGTCPLGMLLSRFFADARTERNVFDEGALLARLQALALEVLSAVVPAGGTARGEACSVTGASNGVHWSTRWQRENSRRGGGQPGAGVFF